MTKQLKIFITFIFALFSISIDAVESLQELCAKQVAQGLVSDAMLEQFKNSPDFIQEMRLDNDLQDLIKTAILSSYRPSANALRLTDWIVSISTITPTITLDHNGAFITVAWSPDGSRIATASEDETATIWDARNGAPLHPLIGHNLPVGSVAWSPNGRHIATISEVDTGITDHPRIWDAQNGTLLHTLAGHTGDVLSVDWSPDGNRIATV